MSLVEGPFRRLGGEWRFASLGEEGSKVALHLSFEFSNSLLSAAFRRGFARISERMVADFARRAEALYGSNA
jgi:ribosome-associated toxin RatA of RatAB toxin-antitoxin module